MTYALTQENVAVGLGATVDDGGDEESIDVEVVGTVEDGGPVVVVSGVDVACAALELAGVDTDVGLLQAGASRLWIFAAEVVGHARSAFASYVHLPVG